jgi:hypothetical protein
MDCSTHWPQPGGPPVNVHHTTTQGGEVGVEALFFVIELPARLVTHSMWYMRVRWDHDMGRTDSWVFLQQVARATTPVSSTLWWRGRRQSVKFSLVSVSLHANTTWCV